MLLLKLGWRNLWRRPRRSIISASAIATAFVFLILLLGMTEGLKQQMLENGTSLILGHVQLHDENYLPDRSLYDTLGQQDGIDRDSVRSLLVERAEIVGSSERAHGFALLSTGDYSAGAQLIGVDPLRELEVTTFLEDVVPRSAELAPGAQMIYLGAGLAKEIRAEPGGEVAAVTQAADGSLGNALFTVGGVLRTGLSHFDRSLAILHVADMQELMAFNSGQVHEIALRTKQPMQADLLRDELNSSGSLPDGVRAKSWGDLSPQLRDYVKLSESANGIIVGFVAIFAALGVLNTMMMAVFERTREIGTVSSLGMRPSQIVTSILAEGFFLSALGVVAGLLVSLLLMQYLTTHGLDLSRWTGELTLMNTHMDPILRFDWKWENAVMAGYGLAISALLAAGIPATRAARLKPVEALNASTES